MRKLILKMDVGAEAREQRHFSGRLDGANPRPRSLRRIGARAGVYSQVMLDAATILKAFEQLDRELGATGQRGELAMRALSSGASFRISGCRPPMRAPCLR